MVSSSVRGWIAEDENAKEMLARVLLDRPFLLIPPLQRVPLRVGNVVEIVGPSPSAKTRILIQAAITCILPKEWNGVQYGGLERAAMFVDLDCRFDALFLSQSLKHQIMETNGSKANIGRGHSDDDVSIFNSKEEPYNESDNELFVACMRRFLYIRCYDSFEFLATLKTMHYQLQKERERHGTGVCLLMIDSIGAFYWIDRASPTSPLGDHSRKCPSLQNVMETSVQEIQKLLLVHPVLVLATKAVNLRDKHSANEAQRIPGKWSSKNVSNLGTVGIYQKLLYREFMPSVWQTCRGISADLEVGLCQSINQDPCGRIWLM